MKKWMRKWAQRILKQDKVEMCDCYYCGRKILEGEIVHEFRVRESVFCLCMVVCKDCVKKAKVRMD